MSKIHSSIQKAIEKSRLSQPAQTRTSIGVTSKGKSKDDSTGTGIFRISKIAHADKEIMEECLLVPEVDDRSTIAAYKVLRTRTLQRMRSNNWRTLVVTSVGAGEGKTLTASNLALSLSRDVNQSVLLVDLDLQRSRVAQNFGFDAEIEYGISDYLNGHVEIPDIIYKVSDLPRISIIPNCKIVDDSSDFLSAPRMKTLLTWIQQQSDKTIVIFDMPPITVDDDVLAFLPVVDAVLLVVAQGKTDRAALERAMGLLADTSLLGVVLNKCSDMSDEGAYGYY